MIDKPALRKQALAARNALTEADRRAQSAAIAARLFALPEYQSAETLFAYAHIGSEAQTDAIIAHALSAGKRVCLPVVSGDALYFAPFAGYAACARGAFGVPEPVGDPVAPTAATLLLAPGVAFSPAGHRLGYGKGYYDRYLPGRTFLTTIGAAYDCQITHIPTDPHDVPLDKILTPTQTLNRGDDKTLGALPPTPPQGDQSP